MDTEDVRREVTRAGRSSGDSPRTDAAPTGAPEGAADALRPTLATLPRTRDVAMERDALMGVLQFGHRMDGDIVARAVGLPFRHPGLDAVRQAVAGVDDLSRPGWAADAIGNVREPFRGLGAELLAANFPAQNDDEAVASATDLSRRLVMRALEAEKHELLGAIQRVAPDSDGGRSIRIRLREIDAERERMLAEE